MTHSKRKIFCKKCSEIKSVSKKNCRTKDRHSRISWKGITGRTKNRENERRTRYLYKKPTAIQDTRSVIYLTTKKRFRENSPESQYSPSEKHKYNCSVHTGCNTRVAEKALKPGILKRKLSETDIIEHYLNPRFSQVASSVLESVFLPEKCRASTNQNTALKIHDERKRTKKIRFEIPEGTFGYEDAKKAMWRSRKSQNANRKGKIDRLMPLKAVLTRHPIAFQRNPHRSPTGAIRPVIPVMERLKKEEDMLERELDVREITRHIKEQVDKAR